MTEGNPGGQKLRMVLEGGQQLRDLMTSSTSWIRRESILPDFPGWQDEYGAFTKSHSHRGAVIEYIRDQVEHHTTDRLLGWVESASEQAQVSGSQPPLSFLNTGLAMALPVEMIALCHGEFFGNLPGIPNSSRPTFSRAGARSSQAGLLPTLVAAILHRAQCVLGGERVQTDGLYVRT